MAEAEEVVAEKQGQFSYMCTKSETLDDMSLNLKEWRKLSKDRPNGDWVMICLEPLKNSNKDKFVWIASPEHPGKGGTEVACRAAWIALMYGRCFDTGLDVSTKESKAEVLAKEPSEFPIFEFPNGKKSVCKNPPQPDDDTDDEEEPEYYGQPTLFLVRYKGEIYSADTLTDTQAISGKKRMRWGTTKDNLLKSAGIQDRFHYNTMFETDLINGKALFKEMWQKHKDSLK